MAQLTGPTSLSCFSPFIYTKAEVQRRCFTLPFAALIRHLCDYTGGYLLGELYVLPSRY